MRWDAKPETVSRIIKQWHNWKEKKMNSWNPIADDISKIGIQISIFLGTSSNFLSRI
jgi:hypothetical protein